MSEPKLISPMLDNFAMGDAISDQNGVRCCPAMDNDTKEKYIVKIISVPASQSQLDALILSGAYSDKESALRYFKTLANEILEETQVLQKLSALEGFFSFENTQLVEMDSDDESGYDIYLLSKYRNTLAQLLRRDSMTHLGALNLALDVCAALAVCRRLGYLYVDLKPENIYFNSDNGCKIGDIGFVKLSSLKFASLSDRYRSQYTAPEINDAFASLNTTIDVYALGLILYQIFNGGQLPAPASDDAQAVFPAPDYADYEMAEIILKACDPDPEKRWQDPVQMGQALVSYMQRNGAHDTLIVPIVVQPEDNLSEQDANSDAATTDQTECEQPADVTDSQESAQLAVEADTTDTEFPIQESVESVEIDQDSEEVASESVDTDTFDETLPDNLEEEIAYDEVSGEVSEILTQADELISHPTPDPVVAPDPIDVPVPPPIQPEPEEPEPNESEDTPEDQEETENAVSNEESTVEEDEDELDDTEPKKKFPWLAIIFAVLGLLSATTIGILFYTQYYLQPIDSIDVEIHEDGDVNVIVDCKLDTSKLSVVLIDTYGNPSTKAIIGGAATFKELPPGVTYTVQLDVSGLHKLTGETTTRFSTPKKIKIVQFSADTGFEDGSVVLNFAADGPDSEQWKIAYATPDGEPVAETFSGHSHTITGLTVGNEYTFTLTPVSDIKFTGTNVIKHTAAKVVKAENLQITGIIGDTLSVKWDAPTDSTVSSWIVSCFNENGYNKTVEVTETNAAFDGVSADQAYTVDVKAQGMSASEIASAAANSITITDFTAEVTDGSILLSWKTPEGVTSNEWILQYSCDNSAIQEIVCSENNTSEIDVVVPGATYQFKLVDKGDKQILGGQLRFNTEKATKFTGYGVTADDISFKMCNTPSKKSWDRFDVKKADYTTSFTVGGKASFVVHLTEKYSRSKNSINTLFVIRNEAGDIVNVSQISKIWNKMWGSNGYWNLNIPFMPPTAGEYTLSIYFNGAFVYDQAFTIR